MLAAFVVAGAVKLVTHEMWRDELQAWVIARSSGSLAALFDNLSHEVHPPLWHLLLFGASRLTDDPRAAQVLHLAVATATVAVVLRAAPFPAWQRRLFAFGYFPFFEYLNISRGYALGLLALVCGCALASRRPRPWPALGLALGALALSSVHGLVLALCLASALVLDELHPNSRKRAGLGVGVGAAVFVAAVGVAVATAVPPGDYAFGPGRPSDGLLHRATAVFGEVVAAVVPVPPLRRQFWNATLLGSVDRPWMGALGLAVLVAVAVLLWRRRSWAALWLWASGTTALLGLSFVAYQGYLRHWGHLFLLLVAACWLQSGRQGDHLATKNGGAGGLGLLFGAVLVVQAGAGAVASVGDLALPFSSSREAAADARAYDAAVLVGDVDFAASAVGAWLDREMLYPRAGRSGTFVVWDERRECRVTPAACVTPEQVLASARRALAARGGERALLVLNYRADLAGLHLVAARTGAVVADEDYWLYELRR